MTTIISILKERGYALIMVVSFVVVHVLYSFVPHYRELIDLFRLDTNFGGNGTVILQGLFALLTHAGKNTLLPALLLALFTGLTIMLLAKYYALHGKFLLASGGTGIIGALIGVLGIGCAACGTLALTTVLGLFGLGFVIRFLPFGGTELYYISIIAMVVSTIQMVRMINRPLVCPIDFYSKKQEKNF